MRTAIGTLIAIAAMALLIAVIAGCDGRNEDASRVPAKGAYLCVGMEVSARFGACPGCALDARRMSDLLSSSFGYSGEVLISERATREAVSKALVRGVDGTGPEDLFIFCYSGHGGQEALGGEEPRLADEKDEYLCLYDAPLVDDEIWSIVSRCRGRVFLYFDACHSATMYRSVASDIAPYRGGPVRAMGGDLVSSSGFTFRAAEFAAVSAMACDRESLPRLLCWSGCTESTYSFGSPKGGVMTNSLLRRWRKGVKYGRLWDCIVTDVRREQPTQKPQSTLMGGGFSTEMEAFR